MTTPWIGITTNRTVNSAGNLMHSIIEAYVVSISNAGAVPVLIPLGLDIDQLRSIISRLEGILFSGGGDVHPDVYKSLMHPQVYGIDSDRDRVEILLLEQVLKSNIPFFGICRGLQLINVGMGGTLYEDLNDQFSGSLRHNSPEDWSRDSLAHPVKISPKSRLFDILQQDTFSVNSWHHQGIRRLADGVSSSAVAPDGVIEAIELPDHPFGLAVQWHPEWLQNHELMQRLFKAFVQAAFQFSKQ